MPDNLERRFSMVLGGYAYSQPDGFIASVEEVPPVRSFVQLKDAAVQRMGLDRYLRLMEEMPDGVRICATCCELWDIHPNEPCPICGNREYFMTFPLAVLPYSHQLRWEAWNRMLEEWKKRWGLAR